MTELDQIKARLDAIERRMATVDHLRDTLRGIELAGRVPVQMVAEWAEVKQVCSILGISDPLRLLGGQRGKAAAKVARERAAVIRRLQQRKMPNQAIARALCLDPGTVGRVNANTESSRAEGVG